MQDRIVLVNRKSENDNWSDRCLFLDDKYSAHKPYNHRSILQNEVVLEYDEEDPNINSKVTMWAIEKLNKYNINYARWKSGNKSQHIHIFIDTKQAQNVSLLKNAFMRFFGTFYIDDDKNLYKEHPGKPVTKILPDLRLCSDNHLIRAEHGLHEKTGVNKTLLVLRGSFPELNEVPTEVWERYARQQQLNTTRKLLSTAEHSDELKKKINMILNTTTFKDYNDGRERALFILIHYLKPKYQEKKDDLIKYLIEWYRYSGGYKMTSHQIKHKVHYHWSRQYQIETMLDELLEVVMHVSKEPNTI